MKEVGEIGSKRISENERQLRTTKLLTLRLMEEICNVVSDHTPHKEALGLAILSEMVAGDKTRTICQNHGLLPAEVRNLADEALDTIRETLSHPTWAEQEFLDKTNEETRNLAKKRSKIFEELQHAQEQAKEAQLKYAELEKSTLNLICDPKRRNAYLRDMPFLRLPVSNELKNHATLCGFYKLGDAIDIHPYDLATKYKFTRPMIDDFDKFIKSAALERKIK